MLDIELLRLRFPVKTIADRTGFDSGNISKYLNGRLPLSNNFVKRFYEVFDMELKLAVGKTAEGQPYEIDDDRHRVNPKEILEQLDTLSIKTLLHSLTKLVENNNKLVESNTILVNAMQRVVAANEQLVAGLNEANKTKLN